MSNKKSNKERIEKLEIRQDNDDLYMSNIIKRLDKLERKSTPEVAKNLSNLVNQIDKISICISKYDRKQKYFDLIRKYICDNYLDVQINGLRDKLYAAIENTIDNTLISNDSQLYLKSHISVILDKHLPDQQ